MENIVPETDQWKLTGICEKCRREPFCRKTCSAKRNRQDRITRAVTKSFMKAVAPTPRFRDSIDNWL